MLRVAAIALFAAGWIPVFALRSERYNQRRAVAPPEERRAMLNAVAAVTLHVTFCELALHEVGVAGPAARLAIGMAVFAIGLAFWILARHTLVAYGRLLDPTAPPPALVTTGPFAVVRHPLALGMVILALGPALAAATPLTWVSFVASAVALARRCTLDEVELRATFGAAYERYVTATPARLVPWLW